MNYLSGRYVNYEKELNNFSKETIRGILVDFYASANEGIFALILLPDGSLEQIGVWCLRVESE